MPSDDSEAQSKADPVAWRALALVVLAQAAFAATLQGLPSVGPEIEAAFSLDKAELGLILACVAFGMLLTLLAWGALADAIGDRRVLIISLTGVVVTLGLASAAGSTLLLGLCLIGVGLFGAGVNSASGRTVATRFPKTQRGTAMGIRQTALPLGAALASLTLPLVAENRGLGAVFGSLAAVTLLSVLLIAFLLKAPDVPDHVGKPLTPPVNDRRILRLAAGTATLMYAQWSVITFLVVYLVDQRNMSLESAAMALAAVQIGGAAARITAGRWSDRTRERIRPLRRLVSGVVLAFIIVASTLWLPLSAVLPILVIAGVVATSWNGLSFTAAAEFAGPGRSGQALGLQNTALALGATFSPPVFGIILELSGWSIAFLSISAFTVAGLLILARLPEVPRTDAPTG